MLIVTNSHVTEAHIDDNTNRVHLARLKIPFSKAKILFARHKHIV